MTFARIAGTGGYLPERVMSNQELEEMVDTSDEWIREQVRYQTPSHRRGRRDDVGYGRPCRAQGNRGGGYRRFPGGPHHRGDHDTRQGVSQYRLYRAAKTRTSQKFRLSMCMRHVPGSSTHSTSPTGSL